MVRFSKFTKKKEIYKKFEKFLSKLVWRETLFNIDSLERNFVQYKYIDKGKQPVISESLTKKSQALSAYVACQLMC